MLFLIFTKHFTWMKRIHLLYVSVSIPTFWSDVWRIYIESEHARSDGSISYLNYVDLDINLRLVSRRLASQISSRSSLTRFWHRPCEVKLISLLDSGVTVKYYRALWFPLNWKSLMISLRLFVNFSYTRLRIIYCTILLKMENIRRPLRTFTENINDSLLWFVVCIVGFKRHWILSR
jgi:hypothetical protein